MAVSNYINSFGEPATDHDLEHIFDVLNENNDDRIQFREFIKHTENCGFKASRDDARKVFDHIASVTGDKIINKKAWINGINVAHQNPLTEKCYHCIVSGGQYDPQKGRPEMDMDDITKSLKDIKAEWEHRIACMESLARQLCSEKMSVDKFHTIFRSNHVGLTKQARDRRSNVMRVACETEAKLIQCWKKEFSKYGSTLIEYMFELVRLKIAINNQLGRSVLLCLVKNCPDRSKLKFLEILGKEANHSKYQNLRPHCFDIILVYFHHQTDSLKDNDDFWNLLMKVTKKGVEDVDQIRNAALHLLAAIQVERHDLAFPIIKGMNEHLRKRYNSEYQISRGSGRGKKEKKKKPFKDDFKSNGNGNSNYLSTGNDSHMRKHTWSTHEMMTGFAQMQLKLAESSKKKKKHKEKDKTKVRAKFPQPPPGEFYNYFGETLQPSDILYAFQFIDIKNDRKITIDEMQIACGKMELDKPDKLFKYLDVNNNDYVDFNDFKQALAEKKSKLTTFWKCVLGGKHLEQSPRDVDFDIEDANKVLSNEKSDANQKVLAIHSITRKMCTKLSEEKFHKLFKKVQANLLIQLYDRKNYVIRETCVCIAKIMIARRAQFVKFAVRVLDALYEIIKINDDKTHISAHQAAKVLIRFIPDSKKFPIFAIVCRGSCAKEFSLTRNSSFEYVNHILARMVQVDQTRSDRFWAYVEKILDSGLCDADQGVRDAAYSTLAKTEILRPKLANEYMKSLRKAQTEKYNSIKNYVLSHIQEEDFGSEGAGLLIALGGLGSNGSAGEWGQVVDSPRSDKSHKDKHKKKTSASSSRNLGVSPKIGVDTRFTLTPQGFAELGAIYNKDKKAKEEMDKKDKKQQSRKSSKSPNPHKRAGSKSRAQTVSEVHKRSTSKGKSKKKKNASLTTDDYVPQRKRDRANMGKGSKTRPSTARVSTQYEKNKSKKNKTKKSDALKKETKKKKKKSEKTKEEPSKVSKPKPKPKPKMTMQQQAVQALCVTAHKKLVQVFIEKTEDLMGQVDFSQFRECLEALDLEVGKGDALKAFSELDEEKEQLLDMEQFGHAVHVSYPEYDLLWKQLNRKCKYYATLETLMSLDAIKQVLNDKKSAWKEKTRAMRSACTIVCDQKRKDSDITTIIKKLIEALIAALRCNNQIVVREACITVATMAKERTVCLKGVVGKLLKTCWELLDVKIPLIKFSAGECLKIVIKYVPDDSDNKYLKTLIQGTMLQDFSSVRQSCYECIIVMIVRAGSHSMSNDFWQRIKKIIVGGVNSDERQVKDYAYHCLYAYEKVNAVKAQKLLQSLEANVIAEYRDVYAGNGNGNNASPSPSPNVERAETESDEIKTKESKSKPESPEPIKIVTEDEKEKEMPSNSEKGISKGMTQPNGMGRKHKSITLSTPVPSNPSLEVGYEERSEQIEEMYNKLDGSGSGHLNRFKAMKFLKELMNVNMRNAEIILTGLDSKRSGKFDKEMLTNWAYAHSPEMEPNPYLHKHAEDIGWMTLKRPAIEQRITLYSQLLQLERTDKNYSMTYDLDLKVCILNYLFKNC